MLLLLPHGGADTPLLHAVGRRTGNRDMSDVVHAWALRASTCDVLVVIVIW